ncbi:MAG: hypothetical protein Q9203_004996 [Teloschistes exilis]
MPSFPGSYSRDDSTESDSDEFEIESDDEELRSLKAEIRLSKASQSHSRLADATVADQKLFAQIWKQYCDHIRKPDANAVLKSCNGDAFKGFLLWYSKNHPTTRRLNTFLKVWQGIRQLYYHAVGQPVKPAVGKRWLHYTFCEQKGLIKGNLPKHTVGYAGILGALCYHWTFDTESFHFERDRVQLALFILLLAYTGQRPGAIVESDSVGNRNSNQALKYRDIKLKLVRGGNGEASLLVMTVNIRLDKGKRGKGIWKTLTLFENGNQPAMCPIIYFLALAFADNIFHPRLIQPGLSVDRLHKFTCPTGRTTIDFSFREDILDAPIFRPSAQVLSGKDGDTVRALTATRMRYWMIRLGERAGFPHALTPYCLRRDIATSLAGISLLPPLSGFQIINVLEDSRVSQPQLLRILGHRKIETYINHYQSTNVVVDVQSTFLGTESKSDMIKEIGRLCQRLDLNLPRCLTKEQQRAAYKQPKFREKLRELELLRSRLKRDLEGRYGTLTPGRDTDADLEYKRAGNRLSYSKRRAEKEYLREILGKFHTTADLDAMVNQLEKNEHSIAEMLPKPRFVVKKRQRLATSLFQSTTETSFAQIVRDLSTLCARSAGGGSTVKSHGLHPCDELKNLEAMTDIEFSSAEKPGTWKDITRKPDGHGFDKTSKPRERMEENNADEEEDSTDEGSTDEDSTDKNRREKVAPVESLALADRKKRRRSHGHLMCLFYSSTYTNQWASKPFKSRYNLRKHYENVHFRHQVDPFRCPVPGCNKLLTDSKEFAEHASTVHHNLIGVHVTLKSSEDVREKHLKDSRRKMDRLVPQTMIDEWGQIVIV